MANVKISNLTAATTPVAGTEVLPIVQSGSTVKVSIANLTAGRAVSVLSLTSTNDSTISGLTVGKGAGAVSTNTAVGASALAANTSGSNNTAVGNLSANSNTTGVGEIAIGSYALYSNTTGSHNTAIGARIASVTQAALQSNTTGGQNVAVGNGSLSNNTTASNNTAVGYEAGYTQNGTTQDNTYLGYQAGYTNTARSNAFLGAFAGYAATSGGFNTFVGCSAGDLVTSGSKNTILGRYNGNQGSLDIRTSSNYIVLSDGDGNPRGYFTGASWIFNSSVGNAVVFNSGSYFHPTPDNAITLGFSSLRWSVVYAATGTINTSDANTKQDITNLDNAEKQVAITIKSLIKKYRFKDAVAKKGDAARIHIGAVAQEVQDAFVAEGLDPARYALFCSDTWYEVDGKPAADLANPYTAETEGAVEVTRLGLRYDELLAFVIAAM